MVLEQKIYDALESVVGADNISQDPAICLANNYQRDASAVPGGSGRLGPHMPEAILLPGSTEEVADIVKVCNKFKVKFKAFSMGWTPAALPGQEGMILIDLRRMNRIVEIDAKNMYAVVEPFVIARQLEAEAEKVGLTAAVTGASSSHSVLASCTSGWGYGMKGPSCGHNNANLLGVEWVLPTGDVVRFGSVGAGSGWFSGDGPGPSLRGIARGYRGALGGNGIFTRCATKLYPWPGPTQPELVGEHPQTGMNLPENFKLFLAYWPDWDSEADAMYKINDYTIGMVVWRNPLMVLAAMLSATNNKTLKYPRQLYTEKYRYNIDILLAAHSMRELEYQERVVRDIVSETGGEFITWDKEPLLAHLFKDQIPVLYMYYIANPYAARIFRAGGDFTTAFGAAESWDLSVEGARLGEEILKESKSLSGVWPEIFWGGPYAYNRYTHFEGAAFYDPTDPESVEAKNKYREAGNRASVEKNLGLPIVAGSAAGDWLGPLYDNYHLWTKRIKKATDPDNLSDNTFFIERE